MVAGGELFGRFWKVTSDEFDELERTREDLIINYLFRFQMIADVCALCGGIFYKHHYILKNIDVVEVSRLVFESKLPIPDTGHAPESYGREDASHRAGMKA